MLTYVKKNFTQNLLLRMYKKYTDRENRLCYAYKVPNQGKYT